MRRTRMPFSPLSSLCVGRQWCSRGPPLAHAGLHAPPQHLTPSTAPHTLHSTSHLPSRCCNASRARRTRAAPTRHCTLHLPATTLPSCTSCPLQADRGAEGQRHVLPAAPGNAASPRGGDAHPRAAGAGGRHLVAARGVACVGWAGDTAVWTRRHAVSRFGGQAGSGTDIWTGGRAGRQAAFGRRMGDRWRHAAPLLPACHPPRQPLEVLSTYLPTHPLHVPVSRSNNASPKLALSGRSSQTASTRCAAMARGTRQAGRQASMCVAAASSAAATAAEAAAAGKQTERAAAAGHVPPRHHLGPRPTFEPPLSPPLDSLPGCSCKWQAPAQTWTLRASLSSSGAWRRRRAAPPRAACTRTTRTSSGSSTAWAAGTRRRRGSCRAALLWSPAQMSTWSITMMRTHTTPLRRTTTMMRTGR